MVSKELLGIRGDVIVEYDVAEACELDDDHPKRKSKQQRKICSKLAKFAISAVRPAAPAVSPDGSAVSPACRFARRTEFVKNSSRSKTEIRRFEGEIDQIKAGDARGRKTITQAMKSMDQNQEKLTRSRDRSQDPFGAIFGEISNLWWKSQIGDESVATKSC